MTGKEKILKALRDYGRLTDEELVRKTKMNPSSARTRRHELEMEGLIRVVGSGVTKSGRSTWIWGLTNNSLFDY